MPNALAFGIEYDLFWHLNPRKLKPFEKAREIKSKKEIETIEFTAWINGIYNAMAISACIGKGKKYPEKPNIISGSKEEPERELTEEEKEIEREKLVTMLSVMQTNFEIDKAKKK